MKLKKKRVGNYDGKHGGRARAEALTAEQRSAIARKAAKARWGARKKKAA